MRIRYESTESYYFMHKLSPITNINIDDVHYYSERRTCFKDIQSDEGRAYTLRVNEEHSNHVPQLPTMWDMVGYHVGHGSQLC